MARVTVEDCIEKVPNRFQLVLTAAQRARLIRNGEKSYLGSHGDHLIQRAQSIQNGEKITGDAKFDKDPVIALREIAENCINIDHIDERIIQSLQRVTNRNEDIVPVEDTDSAKEDPSNLIGLNSIDNLEDSGLQIGTTTELDATGFEDVDIDTLNNEHK